MGPISGRRRNGCWTSTICVSWTRSWPSRARPSEHLERAGTRSAPGEPGGTPREATRPLAAPRPRRTGRLRPGFAGEGVLVLLGLGLVCAFFASLAWYGFDLLE